MINFRFATPQEWRGLKLPTGEGWLSIFITDNGKDFPAAVYPVLDELSNLNSHIQLFFPKKISRPEWASDGTEAKNSMHRNLNEFIFNSFDAIVVDDKKNGETYVVSKEKVKTKPKGFG